MSILDTYRAVFCRGCSVQYPLTSLQLFFFIYVSVDSAAFHEEERIHRIQNIYGTKINVFPLPSFNHNMYTAEYRCAGFRRKN